MGKENTVMIELLRIYQTKQKDETKKTEIQDRVQEGFITSNQVTLVSKLCVNNHKCHPRKQNTPHLGHLNSDQ